MQRARRLLQSTVIVIALFALGKLVGLFRARLVAQAYGATAEFDAFTAANQLPEVFFVVIAGGSLAAAFIPIYSQYLTQESRADSARAARSFFGSALSTRSYARNARAGCASSFS